MKTGSKLILRTLLPVTALMLAVSASGQDFGAAFAHEAKPRPVVMRHPGLPVAVAESDAQGAAALAAPVRPAAAATYAVWWVVMNNPGFCGGICGLDDLAAADLGASLYRAAGLGPESVAPTQPPASRAAVESVSEDGDDICQPAECTDLQRATFLPPD